MRILSIDLRGQEGRLINFAVWNGIAAPQGHLKMTIKVTLPPKNGMIGDSKYHHEDVKWNGTDKDIRRAILHFLSKWDDKEFDIRNAMYSVKIMFV